VIEFVEIFPPSRVHPVNNSSRDPFVAAYITGTAHVRNKRVYTVLGNDVSERIVM
jgi:hypothetical protein